MHNNTNNKKYLIDNVASLVRDFCLENTDFGSTTFSFAVLSLMLQAKP